LQKLFTGYKKMLKETVLRDTDVVSGRCQQILIRDLIPEEHTNWKNFLLLLDIVNELFAAVTHPHRADYLSIYNSWRISRRLQRALP